MKLKITSIYPRHQDDEITGLRINFTASVGDRAINLNGHVDFDEEEMSAFFQATDAVESTKSKVLEQLSSGELETD